MDKIEKDKRYEILSKIFTVVLNNKDPIIKKALENMEIATKLVDMELSKKLDDIKQGYVLIPNYISRSMTGMSFYEYDPYHWPMV